MLFASTNVNINYIVLALLPATSSPLSSAAVTHLKVNGAVSVDVHLHDQGQELVLCWILSHGPHDAEQLLGGDRTTSILTTNMKLMQNIFVVQS